MFPMPQIASPVPVLHILDAVAEQARAAGVRSVGLTGTGFTMADGFYAAGLESRGLAVVLPTADEQAAIHRIIYDELIRGEIVPASVAEFTAIAQGLVGRGADAVLLACTELELLTRPAPLPVPVLDTTQIHADTAWEIAMGRRPLPTAVL